MNEGKSFSVSMILLDKLQTFERRGYSDIVHEDDFYSTSHREDIIVHGVEHWSR